MGWEWAMLAVFFAGGWVVVCADEGRFPETIVFGSPPVKKGRPAGTDHQLVRFLCCPD